MTYITIQRYSINKPKNSSIDDKNKQIYRETYITDW